MGIPWENECQLETDHLHMGFLQDQLIFLSSAMLKQCLSTGLIIFEYSGLHGNNVNCIVVIFLINFWYFKLTILNFTDKCK